MEFAQRLGDQPDGDRPLASGHEVADASHREVSHDLQTHPLGVGRGRLGLRGAMHARVGLRCRRRRLHAADGVRGFLWQRCAHTDRTRSRLRCAGFLDGRRRRTVRHRIGPRPAQERRRVHLLDRRRCSGRGAGLRAVQERCGLQFRRPRRQRGRRFFRPWNKDAGWRVLGQQQGGGRRALVRVRRLAGDLSLKGLGST